MQSQEPHAGLLQPRCRRTQNTECLVAASDSSAGINSPSRSHQSRFAPIRRVLSQKAIRIDLRLPTCPRGGLLGAPWQAARCPRSGASPARRARQQFAGMTRLPHAQRHLMADVRVLLRGGGSCGVQVGVSLRGGLWPPTNLRPKLQRVFPPLDAWAFVPRNNLFAAFPTGPQRDRAEPGTEQPANRPRRTGNAHEAQLSGYGGDVPHHIVTHAPAAFFGSE
jgi:hypothetical protein